MCFVFLFHFFTPTLSYSFSISLLFFIIELVQTLRFLSLFLVFVVFIIIIIIFEIVLHHVQYVVWNFHAAHVLYEFVLCCVRVNVFYYRFNCNCCLFTLSVVCYLLSIHANWIKGKEIVRFIVLFVEKFHPKSNDWESESNFWFSGLRLKLRKYFGACRNTYRFQF